jgi:hypothetical protein
MAATTLTCQEAVQQDVDGVRRLALVLAEMFRVGLALIAKRYPETKGATRCTHCEHRS